jgi:hypothetical protein
MWHMRGRRRDYTLDEIQGGNLGNILHMNLIYYRLRWVEAEGGRVRAHLGDPPAKFKLCNFGRSFDGLPTRTTYGLKKDHMLPIPCVNINFRTHG